MAYDGVVKSIGYNQHEILYNIMQLHNDGKPFDCDPTYSIGNFYGKFNITKDNGETQEFSFESYAKALAFEDFCIALKEQS